MGLFFWIYRFLNPRLIAVIKDIANYFFIGRMLTKAVKSKEWKELNLRRGWFNVAYTVVNLPPEVYESEEIYYRTYVIEQLRPVNEYILGLNLSEVVSVEVEDKVNKEEGEFAYLVKYEPIFNAFNLRWIIKWTIMSFVLWWISAKFGLASSLFALVRSVYEWIKV